MKNVEIKNTLYKRIKLNFTAICVLMICLACGNYIVDAQDKQSQQNYQTGIPFSISDIEDINLTNGNLMFNFNFGAVKGGGTAMRGLSLKYNSKLYESHIQTTLDNNGHPADQKFLRADQEGGWQYDSDYELRIINRNDELDQPIQVGGGCVKPTHDGVYVWKLMMNFPDGSQHEFRPTGYSDNEYNNSGIPIYDGNGYFNVDTTGRQDVLVWNVTEGIGCNGGPVYSTAIYTFQNPNPKMTYYSSDGTFMRLEIPNGQNSRIPLSWTLYMPDGSKVTNAEQGGILPQKIYDKNGNFVTKASVTLPDYSTVTGYVDQFGRYIARKVISPLEDRIIKLGMNGQPIEWIVRWKYITVIRKYTTSGTSGGIGRCCYSDQILDAELKVVDEIELPAQLGGQKYIFNYDGHDGQVDWNNDSQNPNSSPGWGDLVDVTLPSGAKAEYDYSLSNTTPFIFTDQLLPELGKVKQKRLIYDVVYDGSTQQVTDTWLYSIGNGGATVSGPDGSVIGQNFYRTDIDSELSGRVYKETMSNGMIVERIWANNKVGGCPQYGCGSNRRLNTYVKTEFTTIPDASGNPSLTAIRDLDYDKNGNVTKIKEYDLVSYASIQRDQYGSPSIPSAVAPVRITENAYYNQTEDASNSTANNYNSYWNTTAPNVRAALSSTTVKNASGTTVSRSEFNYFDVNTTANLIETRVWDSTKGAVSNPLNSGNSISTTAAYDSYGNPVMMTDAKGVQTQITYGAITGPNGALSGLYPTQTVSAYGTPLARTSAAAYDFYTGAVTSATDVDNNISTAMEYDALGRPVKVRNAAGTALESWTRTEYNDVARRVIVRSDLETAGDGKKVAVQHYDQLGRVRLSRMLENPWEDPYNETQGIKVETRYSTGNPNSYQITSNPFRAATATQATTEQSMGWTRSLSVNTGRHSEVETFSGAALPAPWGTNTNSTGKVQTDADANAMTVTDQAGKQRRSITNALGQLTRVDEPNDAGTLGAIDAPVQPTFYAYDTLNNLTTVSQGVQTRSFSYNSLSRLLSATNPESGTIQYLYDNSGNLTRKTDARSIQTNYAYDALNRVTQRSYTDTTPAVNYTYDNLPNAKGKLTKVSSSVSTTEYTGFDILGRVTSHKQTTDGTAYTTGYNYNLSGALIEETYPSGRVVKNVLDNEGDLALVESRKNPNAGFFTYANSFTYTAAGAVSSLQLGNGKWESTQFNSRLQPTQIALGTVQNGTDKLKLDYSYGTTANNGNVQSQTITVNRSNQTPLVFNQSYVYDSLNRLKLAEEMTGTTSNWKQTYSFDRYGNRRFDQANTSQPASFVSPNVTNPTMDVTNNRFMTGQGYTYDLAGNVITDAEGRSFQYDAENKQKSAANQSGTVGQYSFDGDGKRVKKISTTETTVFVYDASGKMVAEYSTQPNPTPQVSYLTTDTLGSPRITTDATGQVISRRDFHPFGEEMSTTQRTQGLNYTPDNTRQKFTGYERDSETNLDFAQARMFGNGLGRFTSPDLVGGNISDPQTFNKYVYVMNNPLNFIDPSGYCGTTAGSPDDTPCQWFRNAEGSYLSVSQQEFGDGSGYAGYTLVDDPGSISFRLTTLNGNYSSDSEYQMLLSNNAAVTLGSNGRFVAVEEDLSPIMEEDVSDANTQVVPGSGYFDFNLTGGHYGFVATGGLQVDSELNLFPYVGAGIGTPGISFSAAYSPDKVTPGVNAQIQVSPGGSIGVDRKKNSFTEFNVGSPGASATATWVFGRDDGTVPTRFPSGPNAAVNSPLDYNRPIAPNCSCNVSLPR